MTKFVSDKYIAIIDVTELGLLRIRIFLVKVTLKIGQKK